ncbi:F-box domain [Arabidopsis thaliana x Arabidopsis arenosa]|uniref:F-box domain n=1 Tax=Arabidopsis thaliana x Arabidopsis arenosa TaxID=1240361 RepID=A0A8T2CA50_9BRAS|nr:F-box domain [Arabidopsis thaliana x Arabidopsis arenosa]
MFSVNKRTQAFSVFIFFLSIAKVIRYLTKQRSSKQEAKRLEDFQLLLSKLEDFQLPLDLIVEILKKLPTKSLMRFRCVSKQWSSIISNRRDFIESIMARSLRQPPHKLPVFIFHQCEPETSFTVSSTFSQNTKPKVSIMPRPNNYYSFRYQYIQGFICCSSPVYDVVTIYNPTTRQCIPLPKIESMALSLKRHKNCYFGYDHVMNEYKVLAMVNDSQELTQTFHVFTLVKDCHQWRKIRGNIDEELIPVGQAGVCIDGTIYYVAVRRKEMFNYGETIMLSFDVRSERFYHVHTPEALWSPKWNDRALFNHQGKLGCISNNENNTSVWIMENAEKQEWSNITFDLLEYPGGDFRSFSGITPDGEIFIVQSMCYTSIMPLYVHYYNVKQKSYRKVEIEGARLKTRKQRVFAIHDFVENTMWL